MSADLVLQQNSNLFCRKSRNCQHENLENTPFIFFFIQTKKYIFIQTLSENLGQNQSLVTDLQFLHYRWVGMKLLLRKCKCNKFIISILDAIFNYNLKTLHLQFYSNLFFNTKKSKEICNEIKIIEPIPYCVIL